jgi:hypothetical protein
MAFEAKWIRGARPEQEPLLGTADIQSLADLRNSFSVVQDVKVVLINKEILLGLAIPAILPLFPVLVITTPMDEILQAVVKLLV